VRGLRQAEFAREQAALEARAAKFGLELKTNPYGEDLHPSICGRREIPTVAELAELATAAAAEGAPAPNVDVVVDTLHVYGVDRMNTDEILRYFGDYAPSYVLWLDDSSCNLVFGDAANARRALFSLGQPIRLPTSQAAPADGAMAAQGADGADGQPPSQPQVCLLARLSSVLVPGVRCSLPPCLPASLPPCLDAGLRPGPAAWRCALMLADVGEQAAQTDPVWRRGPNYEKAGFEYAVLMRQAVSTDVKKGKPNKSKRLWLEGSGKRAGGYGGGDYRGERMGGGASRARGPRQQSGRAGADAPMEDLRASLGKAKKERRGRKQRHNPYGMQIDEQGDGAEVTMMEADEADQIINAPAPSHELTAQEQMLLEGASAAVDTMAE